MVLAVGLVQNFLNLEETVVDKKLLGLGWVWILQEWVKGSNLGAVVV